jgi:voltage-gated potassium channel
MTTKPSATTADAGTTQSWRRELRRIIHLPGVEFSIGILIIVSVGLTMISIGMPDSPYEQSLEAVNDVITWMFAVELTIRYIVATRKRSFFREYWIDIIALFSLLRVFRLFRALRLLRMLRLVTFFTRYVSLFPYVARRGIAEYFVVSGLIILTVLFGTAAILALEQHVNEDVDTIGEAFWFAIYSLIAGEPIPSMPLSPWGRVVTIFIMFMNLTIFAMFTGTVSAFMVERINSKGNQVEYDDFSDHVVICGWNPKGEVIVRELTSTRAKTGVAIVVVADPDEDDLTFQDTSIRGRVQFLRDDFTRASALTRCGVARARSCIILSDLSQSRSKQDADARTILAALTVEKLNSAIYTCAELHNRSYGSHLDMGHVNDYVVSGEHSGYMLAQAAIHHGVVDVFSELWTNERGNQFYHLALPVHWIGREFLDVMVEMKRDHAAILVALSDSAGKKHVNPDSYNFVGGETLFYIAQQELTRIA